ncbi:type A von Willebrand factor domain-containing protein [Heterostelium album PN500]|uniref:Type A von Willebrand factor domain-containing protein n=1 Tax=Heterostelium pallidum (strain ATCC 26659 / Pp 5 / PN500) TaxID=670386 RepID=D3BTJ4_HETP5|nr:type A von Willebrand factor domain-containing protein [Heterostelium album PN500]EFA75411.1 type A von Willebrand factor domain-containing protein [Heterostelium album PN500]|eukprot:XP_020427545.1 type A von Willebrand factor domain-containing protein [Heterostelium album PN500]
MTTSHFRYGTVNYQISSSSYNTATIKVELGYRLDYFTYDYTVQVGKCVGSSGWFGSYNCYSGSDLGQIKYGDGYSDDSPYCYVNAVFSGDNWFTCVMTFTHTYPTGSNTYTFDLKGYARFQDLINNAGEYYRVTSKIVIDPTLKQNYLSPVVGSSPIITIVLNSQAQFQILATSPVGLPISYQLATPSQMGGDDLVIPTGLTVSSSGLVSFTPTQLGYYTAQVIVSDGKSYVANDFIIYVVNANPLAPYFVSPTPEQGVTVKCTINVDCTWTYKADSKNTQITGITIGNSGGPAGGLVQPDINVAGAKPRTVVTHWKPTVSQAGSYIISLNAFDSAGVFVTGARSFILLAQSNQCSNGHESPAGCEVGSPGCTCVCDGGWSGNLCNQCNQTTNHGPDCLPNPPCYNGTSNGGQSGDGTCSCFLGWTGPACNVSLVQPCSASASSGVTDYKNTPGYVFPTSMTVYMTATPFSLPISVQAPASLPNVDAFILLDVAVTTTIASDFKTYAKSLSDGFKVYSENVRLGLGYYSDFKSNTFNFQNKLLLGSFIDLNIQQAPFVTPSAAGSGNSLLALTEAAQFPSGWSTNGYHTIVIFVDSDCTAPTPQQQATLLAALNANYISPVIVGVGGVSLPNWNAVINSFKFGTVIVSSASGNDWALKAVSGFTSGTSKFAPSILAGTNTLGFVTTPPTAFTKPLDGNAINITSVNLNMPNPVPSAPSDIIVVTIPGYGYTTATVRFNHQPVAYSLTIAVKEAGQVNFTVSGKDAENSIQFKITQLPSSGTLSTTSTGSNIALNTLYPMTQLLFFTPATSQGSSVTFQYVVNDGCIDSAPGTYTINVIQGDGKPPVAIFTNVTTDENVSKQFSFGFTDPENLAVDIILGSLPVNGRFQFTNQTFITTIGQRIPSTIIYVPNKDFSDENNVNGYGPSDVVPFTAINSKNLPSQVANANFYINPRNPPKFTGLYGFTTLENTPLTFPLTATIPSDASSVSLSISKIEGQGTLAWWACTEITCVRDVSLPFSNTANGGRMQFTYTPPLNTYGPFLMKVYLNFVSSNNVASEDVMVYINVTHVKRPPTIELVDYLNLKLGEEIPRPYPAPILSGVLNNTLDIWMNHFVVLRWRAYSNDAPNNTITSTLDFKSSPAGVVGEYNETFSTSLGRLLGVGSLIGLPDSDGFFKMIYMPPNNSSGLSMMRLTFHATDENGLYSPGENLVINVKRNYIPPVIHVQKYNWTSITKQNLVITNVSVESVEAAGTQSNYYVAKNVTLIVSALDANRLPLSTANISLFGDTAGFCQNNKSSVIICAAPTDVLNKFLTQINVYHTKSGGFLLNIYAENRFLRGISYLTSANISATDDLTMVVQSAGGNTGNNKTVLSAAIAAAVVAAAIIALGVWRLVKRTAPPTNAFFGDSPFSDGAISSNPLYQESANTGVNPLYENQA